MSASRVEASQIARDTHHDAVNESLTAHWLRATQLSAGAASLSSPAMVRILSWNIVSLQALADNVRHYDFVSPLDLGVGATDVRHVATDVARCRPT